MSAIDNGNYPRTPDDSITDCSQGVCTAYCRQFCYLIFPPPPPFEDDSGPTFSPLIIAIIAVLASAFLLVGYYAIVRRYCRRRSAVQIEENRDEFGQDLWRISSAPPAGLDESVIKAITVCKYRKGDGLIEGTECAVCLGEFRENETLRLLPKCSHAFHAPCIDAWLKSTPNCPLCRANVSAGGGGAQTSSNLNTSAYEIRGAADHLVLVVEVYDRTAVVHHGECGNTEKLRRCVSLGDFRNPQKLLISDILKFEDMDEFDIGSSRGLKRSISTGSNKVKNFLLPN